MSQYVVEQRNNYTNYTTNDPATADFITLEA